MAGSSPHTLYTLSCNKASLGGSPGGQAVPWAWSEWLILVLAEDGRYGYLFTSSPPLPVDSDARDPPTVAEGSKYGPWGPTNPHALWFWRLEAAGEPRTGFLCAWASDGL